MFVSIEARWALWIRFSYDGLLDLFPQSYYEPYYRSYLDEDFGAMAKSCGLTHFRDKWPDKPVRQIA